MTQKLKAKTAAVFLNGEPPHKEPLRRAMLQQPSFFLFADGAYQYAQHIDITPDLVIGDFDSIRLVTNGLKTLKIEDQNTTDFEKALHYLSTAGFERVLVLGSTGKQNDHFLGNLSAALQYQSSLDIVFFDQSQYFFLAENETTIETNTGKTISLYPFPEATGVSTKGLQYPLHNESLSIRERIGTRNISTNVQVSITKQSGSLWIFVDY
jgi:thiamine pyrophosphokinase